MPIAAVVRTVEVGLRGVWMLFRCTTECVIAVSCPGLSTIPRPVRVLTWTPSKKSARSLMVSLVPPVFGASARSSSGWEGCSSASGSLLHGTGFGLIEIERTPGPLGGAQAEAWWTGSHRMTMAPWCTDSVPPPQAAAMSAHDADESDDVGTEHFGPIHHHRLPSRARRVTVSPTAGDQQKLHLLRLGLETDLRCTRRPEVWSVSLRHRQGGPLRPTV